MYYNSPEEREQVASRPTTASSAPCAEDADELVAELDEHRDRALRVLTSVLGGDDLDLQ